MYRLLSVTLLLASLSVVQAQDGQAAADPGDAVHPRLKMKTTKGDIVLELDAEKAPWSANNFVQYASNGFYNGTIFHRVMSTFMIQGGGFTPEMDKKEDVLPAIPNEWHNGLKNDRGTIAMARRGGRPHSATSQFFINVVGNDALDQPQSDGAAYAVFGKVVEGLEIVDAIRDVEVGPHPGYDGGRSPVVPTEPVVIEEITVASPEISLSELASKLQTNLDAVKQRRIDLVIAEAEKAGGNKLQKSASGLMWVVNKEGSGEASPSPTDQVQVNYTGWLLDGSKFDSSFDRGQPATFSLNEVMKGWTEGVGMMKVGEKRMLIIPPDLAYGPQGRRSIPPGATLYFEVELLAINP